MKKTLMGIMERGDNKKEGLGNDDGRVQLDVEDHNFK